MTSGGNDGARRVTEEEREEFERALWASSKPSATGVLLGGSDRWQVAASATTGGVTPTPVCGREHTTVRPARPPPIGGARGGDVDLQWAGQRRRSQGSKMSLRMGLDGPSWGSVGGPVRPLPWVSTHSPAAQPRPKTQDGPKQRGRLPPLTRTFTIPALVAQGIEHRTDGGRGARRAGHADNRR